MRRAEGPVVYAGPVRSACPGISAANHSRTFVGSPFGGLR
jgi:hypothetical protein